MSYGFKILAEGDFALFSRPEMKVERVSYDVPTPGALEGMLKSIYWKPPIRYVIDKIVVFHKIDFINIRRNEVKKKISLSKIKRQIKDFDCDPSIYTTQNETRHQRASMLLKNVRYGIEFHFELTGIQCEDEADSEKKHYNILKRRLENGQCFRQPCFGCSEFPVRKIQLVDDLPLEEIAPEILSLGDVDLGYMCYGLRFKDGGNPINKDWSNPKFLDISDAMYYRPHMIDGIIDVEKYRGEVKC